MARVVMTKNAARKKKKHTHTHTLICSARAMHSWWTDLKGQMGKRLREGGWWGRGCKQLVNPFILCGSVQPSMGRIRCSSNQLFCHRIFNHRHIIDSDQIKKKTKNIFLHYWRILKYEKHLVTTEFTIVHVSTKKSI